MKQRPWVKLWRQMTQWEWYRNPNTKIVFLHLLILAADQPTPYQKIMIPIGGTVTSQQEIAQANGLSRQQVRLALENLKTTNELTILRVKDCSLYLLQNYTGYQKNNQRNSRKTTNAESSPPPYSIYPPPLKPREEDKKKERYMREFQKFYEMYPKKRGKEDAKKAWAKIPETEHQKIFSALPAQIGSHDWKKEGGKFIPYPATWLNGKRWEDTVQTANSSLLRSFTPEEYGCYEQ